MGSAHITNLLKAAGDDGLKAEVEVVCLAEGIRLVEKVRTELADEVAALIDRGAGSTLGEHHARYSLGPADLLPGVRTVPSGAYEIVRRQQDGSSYLKP